MGPEAASASSRLERLAARYLGELLAPSRRSEGTWGSVRGTGDALIAVGECLPPSALPDLRSAALRFLVDSLDVHPDGASGLWESEAWDSAIACLALAANREAWPAADEPLSCGIAGLHRLYQPTRGNWNDEPWESSWALLALTWSEGAGLPLRDTEASLSWLASLVDRRRARLVNWHYGALFVLVVRALHASGQASGLSERLVDELTGHEAALTGAMRERLESGTTWTLEAWSNGLVLLALARSDGLPASSDALRPLLRWFEEQPLAELMPEELAFAALGLFESAAKLRANHGAVGPKAGLRRSVWERISARCPDYRARPPLLSRELPGFYTIHLPKQATRAVLILLATALVATFSSLDALGLPPRVEIAARWVAIAAGALATVLSLLELPIRSVLRSESRDDDD